MSKPIPCGTRSLTNKPKPLTPTVKAAFEAAGLTRETVNKYRPRWNHWETWSITHGVDPLAATEDDYRTFVTDDPGWSKHKAKMTPNVLACVYRHIGKDNPARPATPSINGPESLSPTARAAFEAAGLTRETTKGYRSQWKHWEAWCTPHGVDPLDATKDDYRAFAADDPDRNENKAKLTSNVLACVYRHIGKDNPARFPRPVTPSINDLESLSPTVRAAFEAAGLSRNSINMYRPRWDHWETWCITDGVDPLAATHDDYLTFVADAPDWSKTKAKSTSSALACIYSYIGKNNPARPARPVTPTIAEQHKTWFNRFRVWCEDRDKPHLPTAPEDVAAFVLEISQSYPPYDMERARASIAWYHKLHGYRTTSSYPIVRAETALAHLEDKYPKPGNTLKYTRQMELCREHWWAWCHDQDVDPTQATPAEICQYTHHLASRVTIHSVKEHVRAIGALYEDPSPTKSDEVKAAVKAIAERNPAGKQPTAARKELDTEIQSILEIATTQGVWAYRIPQHLTQEQIARVRQAMMAADVTTKTFEHYVRYGWLPFKNWCQAIGISTMNAQPADIAAFLCELSDQVSPITADNARLGLAYCYSLCRPMDNPAGHLIVLTTVRGLKRERPKPPSQMDPITVVEYDLIRATAHNRRPSERPHQADLRGDTYIALIGAMRDAMLRKNEAATALWSHIEEQRNGAGALTIPWSKTDQTAEGAAVYLSPQTMDYLYTMRHTMRQAGIEISKHDKIFRMSGEQVYDSIREACNMAGLRGRYGGHSPRIGMIHDLTYGNVSQLSATNAGRWKSGRMPAYYARKIIASRNAVSQWYAQKGNLDQEEGINPLGAYGLALSHTGARLGQ